MRFARLAGLSAGDRTERAAELAAVFPTPRRREAETLGTRARVRSFFKLGSMIVVTAPIFATYLLSQLVLRPFPSWRRRAHDRVVRAWARACAFCLGMKVAVAGSPPQAPFFLVSNHLSYVDVLAFLTCTRATLLAKSEIASWPLIGVLARAVGTLFIDRKNKRDLIRVRALLQREIAEGRGILVFPEATSSGGDEVLPFKASTLEVPLELGLPVHCAAVAYATPEGCAPARTAVCWWGDMRFVPHVVELAALPGFAARIRFGATPVSGSDRKALANAAHRAVSELHQSLR